MGYRFVLSNPLVDVCLTAPSNAAQLRENLAALSQGPLNERQLAFMRRFGDAAQRSHRWFL